ncbi:MAG: PilZ domain-containing protein [candidate division Zixibacteria bacterium]|nr:PilZ domain-containing protein [candidate division Zixibacteria bacterium]
MEQRTLPRKQLIFYPAVYKKGSKKILGRVVDITTEGMRILSETPMATGTSHKLRMRLPRYLPETEKVTFTADAVWSGSDVNPDYQCTGLRITDISERDVRRIEYLIGRSSFQN